NAAALARSAALRAACDGESSGPTQSHRTSGGHGAFLREPRAACGIDQLAAARCPRSARGPSARDAFARWRSTSQSSRTPERDAAPRAIVCIHRSRDQRSRVCRRGARPEQVPQATHAPRQRHTKNKLNADHPQECASVAGCKPRGADRMSESAGTDIASQALRAVNAMRIEIGKALIGQDPIIEQVLIALLAGGHVLIEGVPGLGKTLLV